MRGAVLELLRAGVVLTLSVAASPALAQPQLPPLVMGDRVGVGWQVANLPAQKPPVTRYSAETVDGRAALRLDAQASYGNLLYPWPAAARLAAPARLQWAWRVEQPNPGTDLRGKPGDDVAAKVCISFDLPLAKVPFEESLLLRLARSRTGQNLPAATLCWVWGGPEAAGSFIDNAFSRRVRYVVLRTAADASGTWFEETRDIAADFRRAFGDEWPATTTGLPPISAVLVGADADNTGGKSVAHLTDLRFLPMQLP